MVRLRYVMYTVTVYGIYSSIQLYNTNYKGI